MQYILSHFIYIFIIQLVKLLISICSQSAHLQIFIHTLNTTFFKSCSTYAYRSIRNTFNSNLGQLFRPYSSTQLSLIYCTSCMQPHQHYRHAFKFRTSLTFDATISFSCLFHWSRHDSMHSHDLNICNACSNKCSTFLIRRFLYRFAPL